MDWQLIGRYLNLTDAEIAAVDGDNRTVEEKRAGMLGKWKEKFAYKATYQTLIEVLLAIGKSCLLYTSPSPRDATLSRMPSSA